MHWTPKIEMRVIMKPEIILLTLLPWIILGIEKYLQVITLKFCFYLYFSGIISYIKKIIAGMILVFIFLKYVKNKKILQLLFFLILFLLLCLGVGFENYSFYGFVFFDIKKKKKIRISS